MRGFYNSRGEQADELFSWAEPHFAFQAETIFLDHSVLLQQHRKWDVRGAAAKETAPHEAATHEAASPAREVAQGAPGAAQAAPVHPASAPAGQPPAAEAPAAAPPQTEAEKQTAALEAMNKRSEEQANKPTPWINSTMGQITMATAPMGVMMLAPKLLGDGGASSPPPDPSESPPAYPADGSPPPAYASSSYPPSSYSVTSPGVPAGTGIPPTAGAAGGSPMVPFVNGNPILPPTDLAAPAA